MPRPVMTPAQRAANVATAIAELPLALQRAQDAATMYGASDARTLAEWEIVETHGAAVHRQARLLAGKSKGG